MNQYHNQASRTSTMAVVSLVTALLCIPLISVILGHLARGEVRKSNGTITVGHRFGRSHNRLPPDCRIGCIFGDGFGRRLLAASNRKILGADKRTPPETGSTVRARHMLNCIFSKPVLPHSLDELMESPRSGSTPWSNKRPISRILGQPYQYRYPGEENPDAFDLWTVTPDGRTIGNWY